jgi:hypothetical protein
MVNLIVTIPGTSKDRLAVTGHYDTKLFREFRFVGASDGGSSAGVLGARARPQVTPQTPDDGSGIPRRRRSRSSGAERQHDGSRHYVDMAKRRIAEDLKAMVLVDMIADRDLGMRRDSNSTKWLTDIIWGQAAKMKLESAFLPAMTTVEDDHLPFLAAGVPSVDIIDLDYDAWHTQRDTLDAVSARSLQVVGDVLLASLPQIEARTLTH